MNLSEYRIETGSFDAFRSVIAFEQRSVTVYGKTHPQPRLTKWYAGIPYTYSGLSWEAAPMPEPVDQLRHEIERLTGERFNSVLCNMYRDGSDTVGWHSDNEPIFGSDPVVASVSFGASRRFLLRSKADHGKGVEIKLTDGSLLVMGRGIQRDYEHSIPRQLRVNEPRINLTFRNALLY